MRLSLKYALSACLYLHSDCFNQRSCGEAPSFSDTAAHFLWQYLTLQTAQPVLVSELRLAFSADQYGHKFIEE